MSGVPREDRQGVMRAGLWPWVPLGGDGHMVWERERFQGGHNRCFDSILAAKSFVSASSSKRVLELSQRYT